MFIPGIISGKTVKVMGYNPAVATSEEHLNDASGTFNEITAATPVKVASANAADASAGTGARTVRLFGLDGSYKLTYETLAMNGQTPVTSLNSFLAIFGIEVETAGSGGKNAGIIYVADDDATFTSGVPGSLIFAQMPAGFNLALSGNFIIPAGHSYRLKGIIVGNRAQVADIFIKAKEYGGVWKYLFRIPVSSTQPGVYVPLDNLDIVFDEKTSIELAAVAGTSGAVTQAIFILERMK